MRNAREEIARGRTKKEDYTWSEAKLKYKYLLPLVDKEKYLKLVKPYPKRVESRDIAATANHAVEGGENPTSTLQGNIMAENSGLSANG